MRQNGEPPVLALSVLGPPCVCWHKQELHFPTRKTLALVIYLAITDVPQSRAHLAAMLWPDLDDEHARATLRRTLTYVKEAFTVTGMFPILSEHDRSGNTRLHFVPNVPFLIDSTALKQAHTLLTQRSAPHDPHQLIGWLEQALQDYGGPFLEDFALNDAPEFTEWVTRQRVYWQGQVHALFDALTRLHLDTAAFRPAAEQARRWIHAMPLEEVAYQRLMEALAAIGERTEALATYHECCQVLHTAIGADVTPATANLAERMRQAVSAPTPPCIAAFSPAFPFVGRQSEFAALIEAYQRSCREAAQLIVVEGETGIGKTRLATEFLHWAEAQGAEVLQGHAYEASARLSYQPVIDAFRLRLAREHAPDDLLADVWLAELVRIFPELYERYPDLPLAVTLGAASEPAAQGRLFEAVAQLGLAFSSQAAHSPGRADCPLVVLLDDIYWAETPTRDLLQYVLQRWSEAQAPILVILTVSDEALATTPDLAPWLLALAHQIALTHLALGPLTRREMHDLLLTMIRGTACREQALAPTPASPSLDDLTGWLYAGTHGHPFYFLQLVRALIEREVFAIESTPEGIIRLCLPEVPLDMPFLRGLLPGPVRDLTHNRLVGLSPVASNILLAGAVLGDRFPFAALCHVTQVPEQVGLDALEELLRRRLLVECQCHPESAGPDHHLKPDVCYHFEYAILRDVVYQDASETRRQLYHRQAFTLLTATNRGTSEEIGRHALAAGLIE